ncbi:hypothetical protein FE236_08345 [Mariprofundus erugo]|uniref:hypothetical protein n=1 Tax=Mariprofundus erugo TaxID=2528639 RepID=UPI0010FF5C27|nr:hypothetical protein [Mariprofundus erugo]TLS75984.1 hypothetical protein FE236_08345 [Mariprofundus erugo]
MAESARSHNWRFFRAGGFDQVLIENAEDLCRLDELDAKLWASLSCPTHNLEMDAATLQLIDSDTDGRIRLAEIITAVRWACSMLHDPGILLQEGSSLPLAAINDSTPAGALLKASAQQILVNRGSCGADTIDIADVLDIQSVFGKTRFNGDGIITSASADDEELRRLISEIVQCMGGVADRSGDPGMDASMSKQFFEDVASICRWHEKSISDADVILPLGEETAAAHRSYSVVAAKIDDYFSRCRLASFDPRAVLHMNCTDSQLSAIGSATLSGDAQETRDLPLARIEAGQSLPLVEGVNPAWAAAVQSFRQQVVQPLLGERELLSAEEWSIIKLRLAPFAGWQASRPATTVEALGGERLQAILAAGYQPAIDALIARDLERQQEANAIAGVEKLLRFRRDLVTLLRNFVNFANFYNRDSRAIFQAGTLFLDGRSCELCIRVDDVAKHAAVAHLGRTYLAYCECRRHKSAEKMFIVAAFMAGDSENLMVGRNGVFYDRQGRDWDATIVKIIDHPISVAQAFWSPYKRIGKMIGEQIEKMAAARDKEMQTRAATTITETGKKVEGAAPAKPAAFDVGKFAGIFAAIGLAIGAIGTAIATLVTGFLSLPWWQMPLALVGVVLAISLPSMVIASLKLRQRNLAPLLDANGWAVNTQARINISFGRSLTQVARLPEGAQRRLDDPFADKPSGWPWILLMSALAGGCAAWWLGWLVF